MQRKALASLVTEELHFPMPYFKTFYGHRPRKYQRKPLLNSSVVGGRADNEGVIASVLTGLQTVKEWHSK